jgi:AAA15 family ATPase/GTPase
MIECLELKNFTVFKDLVIDFSPKINVIIGENGTGKTHLLKAAYGLCAGSGLFKKKPEISGEELEAALTAKFLRIFMPLDDKFGKIHHQGANDQAFMLARFAHGPKISATFFNNSKSLAIQDRLNYEHYKSEAVFIPTKEVLSFMKGFNSLYEKYGLSFDQTYQDICLLLDLPEVRPENLHEKSKWAMTEIEGICGGRFVFYGPGKVTFKTENAEFSANSMAEGFRKTGILSRLLETGAIQPGVSGPLFWDEPESNLNPKLMELLVRILLELSRNGQQIILATHDYLLLKWFDLLMEKGKDDHVRFHALYRDPQSGQVKIDSTDDYREIEKNPITEAFNNLTIAHAKSRLKGGLE